MPLQINAGAISSEGIVNTITHSFMKGLLNDKMWTEMTMWLPPISAREIPHHKAHDMDSPWFDKALSKGFLDKRS